MTQFHSSQVSQDPWLESFSLPAKHPNYHPPLSRFDFRRTPESALPSLTETDNNSRHEYATRFRDPRNEGITHEWHSTIDSDAAQSPARREL